MGFEFFALFCTGYVTGLSVLSGMTSAEVKKCYFASWHSWYQFLWIVLALGNILCGALGAVLIFGLVVVGDAGIDRPDFWIRAVSFGMGVIIGFSLALGSSTLIYRSRSARS